MNDAAQPASDPDRLDSHQPDGQQPNGHQPDSPVSTHYATFDWADYEPVSSTVVNTVARAIGVSTADLPELHDTVEPGALDQLFQSCHGGARTTTGQITFEYASYEVTVYSGGQVVVRGPDAPRP